ncbi:DGQHR domain-containing protein [Lewinella sp. JB7]|uniref:DGQHR domain-containing protein n=1 Tax=Lewinella sp. JB7 TaxID=2962887 RepID=UPI0020CA06BC|nr:DGQHR domain-containing protein [Lewinella sp. JB7]
MPKVSFPAVQCIQNGFTFYQTVISSKQLLDYCFIVRRNEDKSKGFNRFLNSNRASQIANYLDKGEGSIPASIIVSAQANSNFAFENDNQVTFDNVPRIFLVLDGQHRLFGYDKSSNEYQVPVTIYTDLTLPEEVSLFIDINTNQKGVPSALLLDIKQLAQRETPTEEVQRELFQLLNQESSIAGLLAPTRSISGKISRKTFNDSTREIIENGPFKGEKVQLLYKGISNYLTAAEIVLEKSKSQNAKLNKTVLFKSLFRIFNDVVDKTLSEAGNLKVESLIEVLDPIAIVDYDSFSGSNNTTIAELTNNMKSEINKTKDIKPDMF